MTETNDPRETRVRELEQQVDTLAVALRAVIDGLAADPVRDVTGDTADDAAARGARLAREVLIGGGLGTRGG
jgi:hypothetical protein